MNGLEECLYGVLNVSRTCKTCLRERNSGYVCVPSQVQVKETPLPLQLQKWRKIRGAWTNRCMGKLRCKDKHTNIVKLFYPSTSMLELHNATMDKYGTDFWVISNTGNRTKPLLDPCRSLRDIGLCNNPVILVGREPVPHDPKNLQHWVQHW